MRTAGNLWPDEHIEALREYVAEKAGTNSYIARLMNKRFRTSYTRNAIIGKAGRLGLAIPRKKPAAKQAKREGRTKLGVGAQVQAVNREKQIRAEPYIPSPNSPQAVALRCVEVEPPRNVPLVDLEPGDCRWPYGDGPFRFCGHPQFASSSYCSSHFYLSLR